MKHSGSNAAPIAHTQVDGFIEQIGKRGDCPHVDDVRTTISLEAVFGCGAHRMRMPPA
ncbi:hypothetical protein C7S16_1198 [Burkholderia thailandensis]|uniref:Uncharacterized protein n=1 Tax=Burkholderia thailandensis TaxID=57975 RepID=A0AAW9D1V3_BURTH|nr:hypothetical protein [Burkholderia thailandensis]MDW9255094.1 hypothetical protein [Burkholderia thailandensis]